MSEERLERTEDILFPSIVFKVNGGLYSINSQYVSTIMQLPAHEKLPEAPPEITGLYSYRGDVVTMLDLRTALHMPSLNDEFSAFSMAVEEGIQNLAYWMDEMVGAALAGGPFLLQREPEETVFGQWYYSFKSEVGEVNTFLKKINVPYKKLHGVACSMMEKFQEAAFYADSEELAADLTELQKESGAILQMLEDSKEIFRAAVFHEMVLVLSDESSLGIVVDEVLAVDMLLPVEESQLDVMPGSPFVQGAERSEKIQGIILQLNVSALIESVSW